MKLGFILIALLKTSGEGGTVGLPYDTLAACEAAGEKLEAQFEAIPLEDGDGNPVDGHPRVVWTCFEGPVQG
jgi:hypothetical protein